MATMGIRAASVSAAVVMVLVLAGGPYAGTAYACSCVSTPLKDEIKRSDAVFSGEVQSIDEGATLGGGVGTATGKVSFAVRDSWKGVTAETVDVYGQGDGVNCFNVFEEDRTYLVYTSRTDGEALQNNACGATKPLADAEADLRVLGPPPATLPDTGGPPLPLSGIPLAVVFLIFAAGIVSGRVRL